MSEYAFDLKLSTTIRVNAASEADARAMLSGLLDCADANFGAWPNGDPVTGEASLDGTPQLFEVNGEEVIAIGEGFHIYENPEQGYRVVRLADGAECTFHGDDSCERFLDNYSGDSSPEDPAEYVVEADEFGAWCEREGELPAL